MSYRSHNLRLYCDAEDQGHVQSFMAVTALKALNGKNKSEMSVETDAGEFIAGGGEEGEVSVSIFHSGSGIRRISQAINPAAENKMVVRTVGGQGTDINQRYLLRMNVVVEALEYFIEHGLPAPTVEWERIG